jgi:quercetin dioxygenase-like cupin family protein
MELRMVRWAEAATPTEDEVRRRLEGEGYATFTWSDAPDADYQPHAHDHDESIWVVAGEIVFGAAGRDLRLAAGDRLMLPKDTVHTAHAGSAGATYVIGQKL